MSGNIYVSNGQEDNVGERLKVVKTTRPIFHYLNDPIHSFRDGISQTGVDIRQYPMAVLPQGLDELADGFEAALQRGGLPPFQEPLRSPSRFLITNEIQPCLH